MRGNPIFQIGTLLIAILLAGVLVAAVLDRSHQTESGPRVPDEPASSSNTVPALLTLTLSAPASSPTFTEPSGRVITIPTGSGLEIEEDVELGIQDFSWSASMAITWQDSPSSHHFLRIDLEPENDKLKSAHILLDFPGDVRDHPITADFNPGT